jgi:hypothetical protein
MTTDTVTYDVLALTVFSGDRGGALRVVVLSGGDATEGFWIDDATLSVEGRIVSEEALFNWFVAHGRVRVQLDRLSKPPHTVTHALFFSGDTPGFQ